MQHTLDPKQELAICLVCNGAEGTLPTECPGELMGALVEAKVYAGEIDFRNGRWVEATSICSPEGKGKR